ncbi:MAG: 16S rRNA (cytidine(1402)-2'-O)-methyltransferase [Myxococcales bacterium]|nr:16S rRNA (cytidine(1402)-2'-O)-methyltransferase [Myxococcales bacterium]
MPYPGKLTLVATPIGNLGDLTVRARDALAGADLIVAEDTRRTGRLLQHLALDKPLLSFFEGNQKSRTGQILAELRAGRQIALVTDAGSPVISDPGYELVYACLAEEIAVEALPGPCAAIMALQLSGLPPDRIVFDGFLPRKGPARRDRLESYRRLEGTVVLYESPNRLTETLQDLLDALGDVSCAVLREMTKLHEEAVRGPVSYVLERFAGREEILGEVTIVFRLPKPLPAELGQAIAGARRLKHDLGFKTKDAATAAALFTGVDKKAVYRALTEDEPE